MQRYLILLSLVSLMFSSSVEEENRTIPEYIEIAKCFLNQQPLIDDVSAIIEMIKTQDYSKAITILIKGYSDIQTAIKECIKVEIKFLDKGRCRKCKDKYFDGLNEDNEKQHRKDACDCTALNCSGSILLCCFDDKIKCYIFGKN